MKKLFVLLLALLVASSAFAQLTINGYERATATYTNSSATTAFANRWRMNASFNDADGNFGVWARIQDDAYGSPSVKYAYGWAKFLDKKVQVQGGELAFYDFYIGCGVSDYKLGNVRAGDLCQGDAAKAMVVEVLPVDGLAAAVTYTPGTAITAGDFAIDAKYTIKDVGTVIIDSKLDDTLANSMVSASFNYTGFEGLNAVAGAYYGANAFYYGYVAKQITGYAIATYKKDAIAVQIAPVYDITNGKAYVEGYVGYKTGSLTVNALYAYDQAGTHLGTAAVTKATYKLDTSSSTPAVVADAKITAAVPSNFFLGLEANYAIGKANLMAGVWYDDAAGVSVPLVVKVGF